METLIPASTFNDYLETYDEFCNISSLAIVNDNKIPEKVDAKLLEIETVYDLRYYSLQD